MKYELVKTDTKTTPNGAILYRVRYLASCELGGWIEAEKNLSQAGNARVSGNAHVYGNARVSGNAHVYGNAQVSGNANILTVGPIGSRGATLTICTDSKLGVHYSTGCFSGSRDEFLAKVEAEHGNNEHGNAYAAAVLLADHLVKGM